MRNNTSISNLSRIFAINLVLLLAWNTAHADDCNNNGQEDSLDISSGSSQDINSNNMPDECLQECDSSVAGRVSFAQFQSTLNATTDTTGDGIKWVCLADGTVVLNSITSTKGALRIPGNNFYIYARPGAVAKIVNRRNSTTTNFQRRALANSALLAISRTGLKMSNVRILANGDTGYALRLHNTQADFLDSLGLKVLGRSSANALNLSGTTNVGAITNLTATNGPESGLTLLISDYVQVSLMQNLTITSNSWFAPGLRIFSAALGSIHIGVIDNYNGAAIEIFTGSVDTIQNTTITPYGRNPVGMGVYGGTIDSLNNISIHAGGSNFGLELYGAGVIRSAENLNIAIGGSTNKGIIVQRYSSIGTLRNFNITASGDGATGIQVGNTLVNGGDRNYPSDIQTIEHGVITATPDHHIVIKPVATVGTISDVTFQ